MAEKRRRLLKALALSGGAVGAAKLPSNWTRPAIDSVMLPAHAQTTGNVLSGSTDIAFTLRSKNEQAPLYADIDNREASILDHIVAPARAGGGPEGGRAFGYAEPAPSRGPGWFFVQLLFRVMNLEKHEGPPPPQGIGRHDPRPGSSLLDSVAGPAHAGVNGFGSCYEEVLWETFLEANIEQGDGRYRSNTSGALAPAQTCGLPPFVKLFPVNLRLQDLNGMSNATSGALLVGNIDFPGSVNLVPLGFGGSRLAATCLGNACTAPDVP